MAEFGNLLTVTPRGLYCPRGDFYIDPWRSVDRAIITHAHSDHARSGCGQYLTSDLGCEVLRQRLSGDARISGLAYGEAQTINGVRVSLHPAGHILGSAQVRLESQGRVAVVSGDYKVEADDTATPFEPVRCHLFVTESTFGLPVYRWAPQARIRAEINDWWSRNQTLGRTSVLFAYSLGKAQRVLAGLDANLGPIYVHGAVAAFLPVYATAGVRLPAAERAVGPIPKSIRGQAAVVAPPSAAGTPWLRKFGSVSTAFVSGWMALRGTRRRRALDRGFALSDHADWPALLSAISATQAETIWVTHGYRATLARWLTEKGWHAVGIETEYEGEVDSSPTVNQDEVDHLRSSSGSRSGVDEAPGLLDRAGEPPA